MCIKIWMGIKLEKYSKWQGSGKMSTMGFMSCNILEDNLATLNRSLKNVFTILVLILGIYPKEID